MLKKVMIVGQKWLAAEVFKLCQELGIEVVAVASPSIDDRLAIVASGLMIPVIVEPRCLKAHHIPTDVDLLICAHAHCFIASAARAVTKLGAIGYHPSLLPRHRGRDAIHWVIHMGERITGGTVYWLTDKADAGAIAAQDWCWVRGNDTSDSLWRRELAPMGLTLFRQVLVDLLAGRIVAEEQDNTLSTWEPAVKVSGLACI